MKVMNLQLIVKDNFEPGQCNHCPLYNKTKDNNCILSYRDINCPLKESYTYEEDYNSAGG